MRNPGQMENMLASTSESQISNGRISREKETCSASQKYIA